MKMDQVYKQPMLEQNALRRGIIESPLFTGVDHEIVEKIIDSSRLRTVEQGEYVYRQGENHHRFYIVVAGIAELSMMGVNSGQLIAGRVGPGGHFGETALLTGTCNCIDVRALTRLTMLSFDAPTFHSVLLGDHLIVHQLCRDLAKRLRVSFHDHANSLAHSHKRLSDLGDDFDSLYFRPNHTVADPQDTTIKKLPKIRLPESTLAKQIGKALSQFGDNREPVLLTGESGTGRRMLAREIHRAGILDNGPYIEIDARNIDPMQLEGELFGYEHDTSAFPQIDQLGIFDREQGGTVVLYHAEHLEPDFQRQLVAIIRKKRYAKVGGDTKLPLSARIILICTDGPYRQDGQDRLLPTLYALLAKQYFRAAPLRMHRRDIPQLVHFYLQRYCRQYGKKIDKVDDRTMGVFMNYDWPGNLTEMASVIQRAVILGKNNEPLNDQMLLGLPRSEGKWEFNLLRLQPVRRLVTSRLFPVLPRVIVGVCLVLVLAILFFGPAGDNENIGLTLSWMVGWPLLIFSFFFLARTWCSVCGLAIPGWLGQRMVKPQRPTPEFIRRHSGWIMTFLCIFLFWLEIAWDAYHSPLLTAAIISAITSGALLFSMLYKRRVWCRYICPLGALNALFSMPSILELRANTHVCTNRCTEHLCYIGSKEALGCPMFRHPFLVDNNRDCILCGQCVKNCGLHSIHLNLRLAPQELWNQQSPRLADSILTVSLAAIFYPFVINQKYPDVFDSLAGNLGAFGHSRAVAASIIFLGCLGIYLGGYVVLSWITAKSTGSSTKTTSAILGYGMIPLVLGAFMAVHLEIFAVGIAQLIDTVRDNFDMGRLYHGSRIMSRDAIWLLQFITIAGGMAASLYATRRIIKRLVVGGKSFLKAILLPSGLLCLSALAYLVLC